MSFLFNEGHINWRLISRRLLIFLFFGMLILYGIWPWLPGKEKPTRTLVLFGFSILSEVINEGIFPEFQKEWEGKTGEKVELISSFAGSGTVTNQIILGVPAEVAILSLELDALRLVERNVLPSPDWRKLPYEGVVNRTPFIIMVGSENPQDINDFDDLTRKGVGVVHPDPLTSGGAQWGLLAEYGSALRKSGDKAAAYDQLLGIWQNVVAQSSSARAARTQFENGFGHALITYEQEAIFDQARGRLKAKIIYPESTILSEHTAVMIHKNIDPDQREFIEAFMNFLWSDHAQRICVRYGFRSVKEELNNNPAFGAIKDPFTVKDLGGWENAKVEIIDNIWKNKVLPQLNR
jgi:sulfate transport system substrate-binding protein